MARLNNKHIELEERDEDGYWIYLKRGWCDMSNPSCHIITESTKREARAHAVELCSCGECKS